jgi:hypothetical protein
MRVAVRWLCLSTLTLGAFACGSDSSAPCSAADAASGRCKPAGAAPLVIPPGTILPDWALQLCKNWSRPDGSCDQAQVIADYEECLNTQGVPEQQRMIDQHAGNRVILMARERATNLCMELRRWFMTEAGRQDSFGGAPPPAAKSPPS